MVVIALSTAAAGGAAASAVCCLGCTCKALIGRHKRRKANAEALAELQTAGEAGEHASGENGQPPRIDAVVAEITKEKQAEGMASEKPLQQQKAAGMDLRPLVATSTFNAMDMNRDGIASEAEEYRKKNIAQKAEAERQLAVNNKLEEKVRMLESERAEQAARIADLNKRLEESKLRVQELQESGKKTGEIKQDEVKEMQSRLQQPIVASKQDQASVGSAATSNASSPISPADHKVATPELKRPPSSTMRTVAKGPLPAFRRSAASPIEPVRKTTPGPTSSDNQARTTPTSPGARGRLSGSGTRSPSQPENKAVGSVAKSALAPRTGAAASSAVPKLVAADGTAATAAAAKATSSPRTRNSLGSSSTKHSGTATAAGTAPKQASAVRSNPTSASSSPASPPPIAAVGRVRQPRTTGYVSPPKAASPPKANSLSNSANSGSSGK